MAKIEITRTRVAPKDSAELVVALLAKAHITLAVRKDAAVKRCRKRNGVEQRRKDDAKWLTRKLSRLVADD